MKKTALMSTTLIGLLLCILALGMFSAPLSAAPGQQDATSTPIVGTTTATATELTTATSIASPTTLATTTVTATAALTPTTSAPSTLPSTGGGGANGPLVLLGLAGVALILAALGLGLVQRGRA
jgi:hypothetical protein